MILRAMKKYGILLADNGSAWFISGQPDERWNNDNLATLGRLLGSNFGVVDATVLQVSANSGEARQAASVVVSPAAATVVSSTSLSAAGSAPAPKLSVPVFVTTPDGDTSNTAFLSIVAASPISVSVSPASASVRIKTTRQFTASVQGTSNTAVTWKVNGVTGGNGIVGTISQAGLYKAPNSVPKPATVQVSATSVADPNRSAAAPVTVTRK